MEYKKDEKWNEAKKTSKAYGFQNKWIEVIDLYNDIGGRHVQIFCLIEDKKYRILHILDSNKVLLLSKEDMLKQEDYTTVNESQKVFFYKEDTKEKIYKLPEEETYFDKKEILVKI